MEAGRSPLVARSLDGRHSTSVGLLDRNSRVDAADPREYCCLVIDTCTSWSVSWDFLLDLEGSGDSCVDRDIQSAGAVSALRLVIKPLRSIPASLLPLVCCPQILFDSSSVFLVTFVGRRNEEQND